MSFKVDFLEYDDIKKMRELCIETFGEALDIEVLEEWYYFNKYQWLAAKDEEDNLLGYIGIWNLKKESFDKLVNGEKLELDITIGDIAEFKDNNKVYCHISAFVVRNHNTRIAISLISKSVAYVRFLKEHNVNVEKISTIAVSEDGLKLCRKLGFKEVGTKIMSDGTESTIFVLDLKDDNFSRLVNAIKLIILKNDQYL